MSRAHEPECAGGPETSGPAATGRLRQGLGDSSCEAEELVAEGLVVNIGGLKVVDDVDVVIRRGEILGLIGPNGAGKTTLVNVLTALRPPSAGTIRIDDRRVDGWDAGRLARLGVARTFQDVRAFSELSVRENLEAAAVATGASAARARTIARLLLEELGLAARADQAAGSLPHGQLRWLGIARALAMRPAFLLLDEPAAGLNDRESEEMASRLADLAGELRLGLLVIEHDMPLIMRLCERIQVLDHGRTLAVGSPSEVRADPAVLDAYLGTGEHDAAA